MVRPARTDDLPLLAAVERSAATRFAGTHLAWAAEHTLPPETLEASRAQGLLWVATGGDDRPIGFVCVKSTPDGLYVHELSVARPHQSQGHGRALLDAVIAEARRRGLDAVTLTTDRDFSCNAPFYARCGFTLLDDAQVTPALRAQLDLEASHGHDPARRCAMHHSLRPPSGG